METKICIKCGKEKPLDDFYFRKDWNKHINTCNICLKKYNSTYSKNDKRKKYKKEYRDRHSQEISEYNKEYFNLKKDKINANRVKNYLKRKENEKLFMFKLQIRNVIKTAFKRNKKYSKNSKSYKILGCNYNFLYDYLLKTFKNNYGYEYNGKEPVHIDHIIPLATAKTQEDVIKLCHYTNLQLLKAKDNLKKGKKLNYKITKGVNKDG